MTSNLLFTALDSLAIFRPTGLLMINYFLVGFWLVFFPLFTPIELSKGFRGSSALKTDILSCFTISLRVDNQVLWCIYHGSLLLVHGVTSVQRYGGGLAIAVTGFICWPIPKSRWLIMWIPLYLPMVEGWPDSTSTSLSFQSGSTDLKDCITVSSVVSPAEGQNLRYLLCTFGFYWGWWSWL